MPIKDYECLECGTSHLDRYESLQGEPPPECWECKTPMQYKWSASGRSKPFEAFDFNADNGEVVHIDSLGKLRDVEKRSMERFEQGAGRPFIFRGYSQDRSNKDVNCFGEGPVYSPERARGGKPRIESGGGKDAEKYFKDFNRNKDGRGVE